jgi:hypothetical protein
MTSPWDAAARDVTVLLDHLVVTVLSKPVTLKSCYCPSASDSQSAQADTLTKGKTR